MKLSIRLKVILGFAVVLLICAIAAGVSYSVIRSQMSYFEEFSQTEVHKLDLAEQIRFYDNTLTDCIRGMIINPTDTNEVNKYNEYAAIIDAAIKEAKSLSSSDEETKIFSEFDKYNLILVDLETQMMNSINNEEKVLEIFNGDYAKNRKIFSDNLNNYVRFQQDNMNSKINSVNNTMASKANISLLFAVFSIILGVVLSILIGRAVILPINIMKKELDILVSNGGDLTKRIDVNSKDEIGELADSLNSFLANIKEIVRKIYEVAENVTNATDEISSGSQDLSQRTQEQASSLEETSSAIEELTATVKQNADNAGKANIMSVKSMDIVEESDKVLRETIHAMDSATQASKRISDIINVVNDIAFQTNLLALNAAVEAARAGEQGKGFAVVAVEVRNLAGRSADAAKEIQSLISDSVEKMQSGNQLVIKTGEQLTKIAESIKNMSGLVSEIAAASKEQATGIDEVNKAIMQMDQVTQQNASLVEELSASTESVKDESKDLLDLVNQFKIDEKTSAFKAAKKTNNKRIEVKQNSKSNFNNSENFEKF